MTFTPRFEELDYQKTPLGELILRRRTILSLQNKEVYEIILGEAFLMSSLFTEVEEALSRLGLAAAIEHFPETPLNVVVGGLGLGYTARAALEFPEVGDLKIVDYLPPVIEWHEKEMLPLGKALNADPRCSYVHGDFFELSLRQLKQPSFSPQEAEKKFHAILLDIDHSPAHLLHERHAQFYATSGLRLLAEKIHPGGIFALWSDDPPEEGFINSLKDVFASCESHIVPFYNPLQDITSKSTVYVARTIS